MALLLLRRGLQTLLHSPLAALPLRPQPTAPLPPLPLLQSRALTVRSAIKRLCSACRVRRSP